MIISVVRFRTRISIVSERFGRPRLDAFARSYISRGGLRARRLRHLSGAYTSDSCEGPFAGTRHRAMGHASVQAWLFAASIACNTAQIESARAPTLWPDLNSTSGSHATLSDVFLLNKGLQAWTPEEDNNNGTGRNLLRFEDHTWEDTNQYQLKSDTSCEITSDMRVCRQPFTYAQDGPHVEGHPHGEGESEALSPRLHRECLSPFPVRLLAAKVALVSRHRERLQAHEDCQHEPSQVSWQCTTHGEPHPAPSARRSSVLG
eukprot:scaffold2544_cov401-Prasinococcus_capsulatus_cf.AAC.4